MCMVNNAAKKWLELEVSVLESYKYKNEGPGRTAGSYFLTHVKSLITDMKKDPEMFRVLATLEVSKTAATLVVGAAIGGGVIYCIKSNKNKPKDKKNNIEEKESN